jgi:hydrogenase-4 membrane subunit HyfE
MLVVVSCVLQLKVFIILILQYSLPERQRKTRENTKVKENFISAVLKAFLLYIWYS